MVSRWPEHDTFSVKLDESADILDFADLMLTEMRKRDPKVDVRFGEDRAADLVLFERHVRGKEVEAVRFSFVEYRGTGKDAYFHAYKNGEGRLTEASLAGIEAAVAYCGGTITTRGRHGADEKHVVTAKSEIRDRPLGAFFAAVRELAEIMPLQAACEVAKCAYIPEEKKRLQAILAKTPKA